MNWHAIEILGLSMPTLLLALCSTYFLFEFAIRRLGFQKELNALGPDIALIVTVLIFGRAGFVLLNWSHYSASPWDMINIRDQGFSVIAGLMPVFIWIILTKRQVVRWIGIGLIVALLSVTGIVKWGQSETSLPLNIEAFRLEPVGDTPRDGTRESSVKQHMSTESLGQILAQAKANNQAVVINLWASWCPPCRREMPALQSIHSKRDDVVIILVNQQESVQTVTEFLTQNELVFPHIYRDAQGQMMNNDLFHVLPTTLFFDSQGRFESLHSGELTQSALHAKIDDLIAQ